MRDARQNIGNEYEGTARHSKRGGLLLIEIGLAERKGRKLRSESEFGAR